VDLCVSFSLELEMADADGQRSFPSALGHSATAMASKLWIGVNDQQ
jgi:hypothetical protein